MKKNDKSVNHKKNTEEEDGERFRKQSDASQIAIKKICKAKSANFIYIFE